MSNFSQLPDFELSGFFSDLHKEVTGFRPHFGFWDRQKIVDFCERWTCPEGIASRGGRVLQGAGGESERYLL